MIITGQRQDSASRQNVVNFLFLYESSLEPAPIHLQTASPVHEHASIEAELLHLERRLLHGRISSLGVGLVSKLVASPNGRQLVLLEEVDPGTIATYVEVLLKVATLLEPDLGEITPPIVTEADLTTGLEHTVDILDGLLPLQRVQCREDEDEKRNIHGPLFQAGRELIRRDVPHIGLYVFGIVVLVRAHDLDGLLGKITGVNLELRVLVLGQDGESRIAGTSSYLKERDGAGVLLGYLVQHREFLLQPLAVFEEVGSVVLIEQVPPLDWV